MPSRGEAWALTIISGLFVLAGIFVIGVVGEPAVGLLSIVFFGATLVVGLLQLVSLHRGGTGEPAGPVGLLVMAAASFLLGVACLMLALVAIITPESLSSPGRSPLVGAVAGAVGTIFFGGGSGLLVVRAVVVARRR